MCGTAKEPNQLAIQKGRRDDGDVVQVSRSLPRIIGDVDIALKHVVATNAPNKMRDRIGHCIDVPGGSGHGLCEHISFGVINSRR